MNIIKKTLLACSLLLLSQFTYADSNTENNTQAVKNFTLQIWAPDEVPPASAKPVEFGSNYQYQYTPESHELNTSSGEKTVEFTLHKNSKSRYQFRWISADHPQLVSLQKVKKKKRKKEKDSC